MDQEPLPPPDFALPGFAALVALTMATQWVERDKAIVFLERRWEETGLGGVRPDRGDDGNPDRDEEAPPPQPDQDPPQLHDEEPPRGNQARAGRPAEAALPPGAQPIMFDPDRHIATTLTARPADYAIKRLEARKHVPLWYFSREGLREAARTVRQSDENDTLAITKAEEGQVTVRSAGSLAASKNAKLDHQLSFSEFMYAKNLFLMAIDNAKWGDDATDAFNWFFHRLDNHSMRKEGERGERVLLHYVSRARTDWHDKLALHEAYNIATINEDLLAKIARELDSREVRTNLEQVHLDSCESVIRTNTAPLPPPFSRNLPVFANHVSPMLLLLTSPSFYRHADTTAAVTAATNPAAASHHCLTRNGVALDLSR
jgi:hypothetical protein